MKLIPLYGAERNKQVFKFNNVFYRVHDKWHRTWVCFIKENNGMRDLDLVTTIGLLHRLSLNSDTPRLVFIKRCQDLNISKDDMDNLIQDLWI